MAQKREPEVRDFSTLIAPVLTEKASSSGVVVFKVDKRSSKGTVKACVEKVFNVKVDAIRVCNVMGKPKRKGMKKGTTSAYKKAYITLKDGYKIEIVEGV